MSIKTGWPFIRFPTVLTCVNCKLKCFPAMFFFRFVYCYDVVIVCVVRRPIWFPDNFNLSEWIYINFKEDSIPQNESWDNVGDDGSNRLRKRGIKEACF